MSKFENQIQENVHGIENIDTIFTTSASTHIDKISNGIITTNTNSINASNGDQQNTIFNSDMYIKCLTHELLTPISNINFAINYIETIIQGETEIKNKTELNTTIDSLYKLLQYTDNILSKFCVIKNNTLVLNTFIHFSIKLLINDVVILLQYNIKQQNIQLECNIDANIIDCVYGDKVNIQHCIINLVKNAIKYGNKNNTKIIINISKIIIQNNFQSIIISVIDNNNSIPKHIKDNFYSPFNSTSGSGLGLYICKKILDLHDGSIEHEYIGNQGNQFNIYIYFKVDNNVLLLNNIENHYTNSSLQQITPIIDIKQREHIKYNIVIVDDSELTIKLHRLKRKMRQNAVIIYIFYNYVSSNLLDVPLLFSYLLYR